ncbi:MAG: hypothetical protein V3S16_00220 [Candidatus Desulfatibia sp.]|uniref:hypothetical protein n=1 Tax=Candidatus Desulfatibia sp. TaxID=3101189 RepID=UPI002F33CC1C
MKITFYGAVREVTGSMHLISTGTDRILLDCGMFQGRRQEAAEKNRLLPFDPQTITNIALSTEKKTSRSHLQTFWKTRVFRHLYRNPAKRFI